MGGASTDLLELPLQLALRVVGVAPTLHVAPYNVWLQEMLEDDSGTSRFAPQVAITLITAHSIPAWPQPGTGPEAATELAQSVCRQLYDACAQLHDRCGAEDGPQHAAPVSASAPWEPFGEECRRREQLHPPDQCPARRHGSAVRAPERRGCPCRATRVWTDGSTSGCGTRRNSWWRRDSFPSWRAIRPLSSAASWGARANASCWISTTRSGAASSVTLASKESCWARELAIGEAFKAFQTHLKAMKDRGVLLAVCSKNDETPGAEAVRGASGDGPQAPGLRGVQGQLEPQVRQPAGHREGTQHRPGLAGLRGRQPGGTRRGPAGPAGGPRARDCRTIRRTIPDALDAARCFEVPAITAEDRSAPSMYRGQRQLERARRIDPRTFRSSSRRSKWRRSSGRSSPCRSTRITQLVNKTNQFNLTTRRLTGAEVEALMTEPVGLHAHGPARRPVRRPRAHQRPLRSR